MRKILVFKKIKRGKKKANKCQTEIPEVRTLSCEFGVEGDAIQPITLWFKEVQ